VDKPPPRPLPYAYPRAGARGVPIAAVDVELLLAEMLALGVPPGQLGPTLVQGFARIYRQLPTDAPGIDKSQIPMLYALIGSGTPPLKMSLEDAAYQPRPGPGGDQRCSNCSSAYQNLVTGDMICSQIEGEIEPDAWCRLWNSGRY